MGECASAKAAELFRKFRRDQGYSEIVFVIPTILCGSCVQSFLDFSEAMFFAKYFVRRHTTRRR